MCEFLDTSKRQTRKHFYQQHQDFALCLPTGVTKLDCCLFIKKISGKYEFIFFNPNANMRCSAVEALMKELRKSYDHKAFFGNNFANNCSDITYEQVYKFMTDGKVFEKENLRTYNQSTKKYE